MHNSNETITIGQSQAVQPISGKLRQPYTKKTRKYDYICLDEALKNLNDKSKLHLNKELFLDTNDIGTKKLVDSIQKGLAEYTGNDSVEVRLRGRKDPSFTAWVSLKEGKGELKFDKSFPGELLKASNPSITAFVLVSPEDKRLARVSQNDDGVRLYEILNESSTIQFNWKVGNKDCSITFNISCDGTVDYIDSSDDLNFNDLEKNEAVKIKIGYRRDKDMDKYNDMTLARLASLARNLQGVEASEVVTINPSTNVTSASTQHVQATAERSAN